MFEIELDDAANNSQPFFPPLSRKLRGRFIFARMRNGEAAHKLATKWGEAEIPGQRLRIDVDAKTATIIEPLNDPKFAALVGKLKDRGMAPSAGETIAAIHGPSFVFHARRLVESGLARVVAGALPADDGGVPKASFISEPQVDKRDALIEKLIALCFASLPASKQKEVAELMGAA